MPRANLSTSTAPFQGLDDKLRLIRGYFPQSLRYPVVRRLAEQLSMSHGIGRPSAAALYANLKSYVRYVPDPVGVELIKSPWLMAQEISRLGYTTGDCDDLASLSYALLNSLGIRARLAVGWYGENINPSHIWAAIPMHDGASLLAFDLCGRTLGETKPGAREVRTYA